MMKGVKSSLSRTRTHGPSVLELSSQDYMGKVTHYLNSSLNQSSQNKVPQEDSDSEDSLFITQNPVTDLMRSRRRKPRPSSRRSSFTSPLNSEDSEDADLPSASQSKAHGEKERRKKRMKKKHRLPRHSFPFLIERGWRAKDTLLPSAQNKSLHRHAMVGFFKCVGELLEASEGGEDALSSLPTVDTDGDISSLTEEEENAYDWDIRVVPKNRFLSVQTCSNQTEGRQETTGKRQREILHTPPSTARVRAGATRSNAGQSSRRVLFRGESNDNQCETQNTSVRPPPEKQEEDQKKRPRQERYLRINLMKCTINTVSEPERDVDQRHDPSPAKDPDQRSENLHDSSNDNVCEEPGMKRSKDKRDHKSVEEEEDQSQEEPDGLEAAASPRVEVEVEETPNMTEQNRAEVSDKLDFKEKEQSAKKKGENECLEGNIIYDEEGNVRIEDSVSDGGKEKKKKKKKDKGDHKSVESGVDQSQEEPASVREEVEEMEETPNLTEDTFRGISDDVDFQEKQQSSKKKRGNECLEESITQEEDGDVRKEDSVISVSDGGKEKRKKKKKDKGDHKSVESGVDQSQEEPEGQQAAASVREKVEEMPNLTEDNRRGIGDDVDSKEKKHCSKKKRENDCVEENITQKEDGNIRIEDSGISVSGGGMDKQKKKKKKKKKKGKREKEDHKSVEAGEDQSRDEPESVWAAASVGVEVGDILDVTEVNVTQDEDGKVRIEDSGIAVGDSGKEKKKKKKKRKMIDEDDEQLQSSAIIKPLSDEDEDAEPKRKKKKREKDEMVVRTDECEEHVTLKGISDLPGELEESENVPDSQEISEPAVAKRKKHKKKKHLSSDDANQDEDVSFSNDSVTLAQSTKKKKREQAISKGVDTPEENNVVKILDKTQRREEGLEDKNAELVSKKKKKKERKANETPNRAISENCVAQSDDSVSEQEKKKKRSASFLSADAGEQEQQHCSSSSVDAQKAHLKAASAENMGNLEGSDHVMPKKKKKRRLSVENDQEFAEPNELHERKKKRTGSESESVTPVDGLESAADVGEEVTTKKKKKKKKYKDDGSTSEAPAETPGKLKDVCTMKLKSSDILPEGTQTDTSIRKKTKEKKGRNKPSDVPEVTPSSPISSHTSFQKSDVLSPDIVTKTKHKKIQQGLHLGFF